MKKNPLLIISLFLTIGLLISCKADIENDEKEAASKAKTDWLIEKYGPKIYSQRNEELIIRDFFKDKRNGFFVDVGASHYCNNSTTYYLEKYLGWSGIGVDAICDFAKDYLIHRKNTRFYCFFVANKSNQERDFYVNIVNKRVSSGDREFANKYGLMKRTKRTTITLNDLLEHTGVSGFDFLSMDIELGEPAALASFDIQKYKPSLACIEVHEKIRNQILDYFFRNGYKIIDEYDGIDPLNYYFTPVEGRDH